MSSKYDTGIKLLNIQSMLVKLISYIIECEHKGYMTKRTKDELLKIIEGGTK